MCRGCVLSGPTAQGDSDNCAVNFNAAHVLSTETDPVEPYSLDKHLRPFWELESLGIHEGDEKCLYEQLINCISFQDG